MVYRRATSEYPAIFLRTITHLLDFRGRSTRTELGIYVLLAPMLFSLIAAPFGMAWIRFGGVGRELLEVFDLFYWLPAIALFIRRAHDMGKNGWWGLAVPVSAVCVVIYSKVCPPLSRMPFGQEEWMVSLVKLGVLFGFGILLLAPPTEAGGRFGKDPRAA